MNREWQEVTLPVPAAWVDLVCETLKEAGSCGVVVEERKLDTFVPPDPREDYAPLCSIRAYFAPQAGLKEKIESALGEVAVFTPGWTPPAFKISPVHDEAWAEGWKQHFRPFRVGKRLLVCPTWEEVEDDGKIALLRLDPGMAFGTGTHATTRLCLETLAEAVEKAVSPCRVLDVGTGSGILAMAAALLGARPVLAVDIDEQACEVARNNIALNRLSGAIEVSATPIEKLDGVFDIVVANILAEELVRLAPHLRRLLDTRGVLILSGILPEKAALVRECFDPLFETPGETIQLDEWCCVHYGVL